MTKTDLPYKTAGDLRPAGDPSPAIGDSKNYAGDVWFFFRHNFFKKRVHPGSTDCVVCESRTRLQLVIGRDCMRRPEVNSCCE